MAQETLEEKEKRIRERLPFDKMFETYKLGPPPVNYPTNTLNFILHDIERYGWTQEEYIRAYNKKAPPLK